MTGERKPMSCFKQRFAICECILWQRLACIDRREAQPLKYPESYRIRYDSKEKKRKEGVREWS